MDGGAWWAIVHGVAMSWTRLTSLMEQPQTSLVAQLVKNPTAMWDTWFDPWVGKIPWGGHGNPLQYTCLVNPHGQKSLAGYNP